MTAQRLRRGVLAALTVAVLASCAAIPTSGPVQEGNTEVSDPTDIDVLAEGPQPGDSPTEIVDGFLTAAAVGFSDGFVTAREYLAGEAKATWDPQAGVAVAGPLEFEPPTVETEVTIDVPMQARVDAGGRYAEAPPDGRESVTFDMVQDDGDQWRIAALPDGLILQREDFTRSFRPASLYFLSPDDVYLVPDSRWFPTKSLPTSIMTELLAGPSEWLQDAVSTAVPDGVELNPQSVTVDEDGVAHVSLGPALAVTRADRDLLLAQINASLRPVPGILSVQVDAEGLPLEGSATLERGTPPPSDLEFVHEDDTLVGLADGEVTPVPGVGALTSLDARSPASNEDRSIRVMLSGSGTLSTVPTTDAPAKKLLVGSGLAAPSVDRFGWAWTGDASSGLIAVPTEGDPVHVTADWLVGRIVRAVRVERDGVRIAVISSGADDVTLDVAAISRDEAGAPQQLGVQIRAGASLVDATSVVWSDESTLAVVGKSVGNSAVHLVPVGGPTRALPEVAKLAALAGGSGIFVTTTDGELRKFVGSTWAQVVGVTGASDPSFPG